MKRNKALRALFTLALAAVLCVGSAVTVFADGDPIFGTEANPAKAAIAKVLQMPEGTITPASTFTFDVTAVSVDGETATATNMPVIGAKSVSYLTTDLGNTASSLKTVVMETGDIFANVNWPHAGVYTYTVSERETGYTAGTGETLAYSKAEYSVTAYVKNKTAPATGLYVYAIGAVIVETDTDDQGDAGDKVDPTPGGDPLVTGDYSEMVFTNTFTRNNGGPNPEDSSLSISKEVAGDYANQSKYFSFNLAVTQAATLPATTVYKVYVLDSTDAVVTSTFNAATASIKTDGNGKSYIEVKAGTPIDIKLKHGQRLSFIDAHVGTKYAVSEAAAAGYAPQVVVVVDGKTPQTINGNINTALVAKYDGASPILVGETTNTADFTNIYQSVTPTGIALDNLPFIMLLVLAAGSLFAFVAVKARKRAQASKH